MTISAKVIEDSITKQGKRLTTLQLRYPRMIHAEAKTHRIISQGSEEYVRTANIAFMDDKNLSRNASSSRAIPVAKMIEQVRNDPAMPVHWGKNQPGMQARAEVEDIGAAKRLWLAAANDAADRAEQMMDLGLHKQVANRILEPFQYISVIVTATEWSNFFELRDHPDADPNIGALAAEMRRQMLMSAPVMRPNDRTTAYGWHLPYVTRDERVEYNNQPDFLAKLSAARCARVSYLNHDGTTPSIEKDLELYDRLVGMRPLHASPIEHQAYPLPLSVQRSNNFVGWRQYRELVETSFN